VLSVNDIETDNSDSYIEDEFIPAKKPIQRNTYERKSDADSFSNKRKPSGSFSNE